MITALSLDNFDLFATTFDGSELLLPGTSSFPCLAHLSFARNAAFSYVDAGGENQSLNLAAGSLAFTFCQVTVVYTRGGDASISVHYADGRDEVIAGTFPGPEHGYSMSDEALQALLKELGEQSL